MSKSITLIEGDSCSLETQNKVASLVGDCRKILVILDSNHTKDHVLCEVEAYSKYVSEGSYLIVLDTVIDSMDEQFSENKPWGPGKGPKSAITEFLSKNDRFVPDNEIDNKLQISVGPGGYLRCIKNS